MLLFINFGWWITDGPVFKNYVLSGKYFLAFNWNGKCVLLFILLQSALSNLEEMKAGRSDSPMVYRERVVRSVGVGPMRSRPNDKRIDTSPYSSGAYLSPPPDTSWRRTNSDSALHQSAMNIGGETSLHSSGSQRRGELFYDLWTILYSWVVTMSALYLGSSWFRSWHGNWLSWQVFIPSRKMSGEHHQFGHYHFILYMISNHYLLIIIWFDAI